MIKAIMSRFTLKHVKAHLDILIPISTTTLVVAINKSPLNVLDFKSYFILIDQVENQGRGVFPCSLKRASCCSCNC